MKKTIFTLFALASVATADTWYNVYTSSGGDFFATKDGKYVNVTNGFGDPFAQSDSFETSITSSSNANCLNFGYADGDNKASVNVTISAALYLKEVQTNRCDSLTLTFGDGGSLNIENDECFKLSVIGATINFGKNGYISLTGDNTQNHLAGKAMTLNASITLNYITENEAPSLVTRYLIKGKNIWYRDVTNDNKVVDYASSLVTESTGYTLIKYDLAKSENAAWTIGSQTVSEDQLTAGAYRFFATESGGIGIQYWNGLTIPEPTTATLSLLALAGLAARRRRK